MQRDVRKVWVVQSKSTGQFLHLDLYLVRSLKLAGRAPDYECAVETGREHLENDFEVHGFFEDEEGCSHG